MYDCKNFAYLYGPEIMEEEINAIFSPDNCIELGFCNNTINRENYSALHADLYGFTHETRLLKSQ